MSGHTNSTWRCLLICEQSCGCGHHQIRRQTAKAVEELIALTGCGLRLMKR